MREIWKSITGYGGYYKISNKGRVFSFHKQRILQNIENDNGYLEIILSKKSTLKHWYIHRLVAINFIPNYENKPQVNHKDGDKKNNYVNNLEWVTEKENHRHARLNGLVGGNKCVQGRRILNENDVLSIRLMRKNGVKIKYIAQKYNMSLSAIKHISSGYNWGWLKS